MTIYHFLLLEWVGVTKYQSTLAASTLVLKCRNIENFQKIFFSKEPELSFGTLRDILFFKMGTLEII